MAKLTAEQKAAKAAESKAKADAKANLAPGTKVSASKVEVTVKRGRRVDHDGQTYIQGAKFKCTPDERDHLLRVGAIVGGTDAPYGNGPDFGSAEDKTIDVKVG